MDPRIGCDPRDRSPACMCGQDLFDLTDALGGCTSVDQGAGQFGHVRVCTCSGCDGLQ